MDLELRSINMINDAGNQRITTKYPYSISLETTWAKVKKKVNIYSAFG